MNKYAGTKTEKKSAGGFCGRVAGKKQVHVFFFRCEERRIRTDCRHFFKDGG